MAMLINVFLRDIFHRKLRLLTTSKLIHSTQVNHLYSPSALGIDNYIQGRKKTSEKFASHADNFRSKMFTFVTDKDNLIFTEDLKNMVHIAQPEDLDLILQMIKKFNTSTELRFGSFVFGPIIMRMFYFLDAPKEALQCFRDPDNKNFFDQQVSYQILLDLLYKWEMYEEMYETFQTIQERQLNMTKYPKYSVVLVLAGCYKQNTPESFKYAIKLWSEMNKVGSSPIRRAGTFFAGLALKQGAPHIALEAISSQRQHYVTIRNIKAVALAQLGRVDDALRTLRQVLDIDAPTVDARHTFFEDTISDVGAAVDKADNADLKKEFNNIVEALRDRSLLDKQNLETHLNSEIVIQLHSKEQKLPSPSDRNMKFTHRRRNNNMF